MKFIDENVVLITIIIIFIGIFALFFIAAINIYLDITIKKDTNKLLENNNCIDNINFLNKDQLLICYDICDNFTQYKRKENCKRNFEIRMMELEK